MKGTGIMSFGPCPVVKIKADNEDGYVVINESDFDPKKGHKAFEGEGAADFVQEPHVTQAIAAQDSAAASEAGVQADQAAWATPTAEEPAAPPVEPIEAPVEAAAAAPAKAGKAN